MGWVEINQRKPKENQVVWALTEEHQGPVILEYVFIEHGEDEQGNHMSFWAFAMVYDVPSYHNGEWICESDYDDEYTVTHWMSLPEPLN